MNIGTIRKRGGVFVLWNGMNRYCPCFGRKKGVCRRIFVAAACRASKGYGGSHAFPLAALGKCRTEKNYQLFVEGRGHR